MRYHATDIEWDADDDDLLELPDNALVVAADPEDICDILSDIYGFCVFGCAYVEVD